MSQGLNKQFFVSETVVYLVLDVCQLRGESVVFRVCSREFYVQSWLTQDTESVEESLAVIQILVFEVENTDQSLHDVSVHFPRDVLVASRLVILIQNLDISISKFLPLLNFLLLDLDLNQRTRLTPDLGGKNKLEQLLPDGSSVQISIADQIGP